MNGVQPLRHAIIGVGARVLNMHRPALDLPVVDLIAVSDLNRRVGQARAEEFGCAFYADHCEMLDEARPDVVVILTPQPFHAALAIDCLEASCHVLVEKPMAVHVAEADAMIEVAARNERLLAVSLQQRYRPEVRAAHRLIQSGLLGQIQHVDMTETWPRTRAYYALDSWRATWAGEGGGVLLNQAPHNLDLLCHLLGMPDRIMAWTRNLLHSIETEDTVQAMMEWPGGALGSLHISTAEAGQPQRLEILGTKGWLRIDRETGSLDLRQYEVDLCELLLQSQDPFPKPSVHKVPIPLEAGSGDHVAVYLDLHNAIRSGTPLSVDGLQGRMSLELANAMIYSSHHHCEVELPLDRQLYIDLLEGLKLGQTVR